jgi:hypothetical protein
VQCVAQLSQASVRQSSMYCSVRGGAQSSPGQILQSSHFSLLLHWSDSICALLSSSCHLCDCAEHSYAAHKLQGCNTRRCETLLYLRSATRRDERLQLQDLSSAFFHARPSHHQPSCRSCYPCQARPTYIYQHFRPYTMYTYIAVLY